MHLEFRHPTQRPMILEWDAHWWEESGVDEQGRICLGSMGHPCPWLPRVSIKPFVYRFPDKIYHALWTAGLALVIGPLWSFLLMTLWVEFLLGKVYDPRRELRVGILDIAANAVGALVIVSIDRIL